MYDPSLLETHGVGDLLFTMDIMNGQFAQCNQQLATEGFNVTNERKPSSFNMYIFKAAQMVKVDIASG